MPELEKEKTGGLTTLGTLSVVFGAVFVITSFWAMLQPDAIEKVTRRAGAPQLLTGFGVACAYADAGVNLVLAVLLFTAGVGLLRLRKWGGRLAAWYALARIGWSVVALVFAFAGPFASRPNPDGLAAGYAEFMGTRFAAVAATEIVGGFVLSAVFAVVLLCLLSRETYRKALT